VKKWGGSTETNRSVLASVCLITMIDHSNRHSKEGQTMNADKYEIARLSKALADTERMWRAERANAKMFQELYTSKLAPANDCASFDKWLCITPCPAGQRQMERVAEAMGGRF
jgi:hypothetical protein